MGSGAFEVKKNAVHCWMSVDLADGHDYIISVYYRRVN